MDLAHGSLPTVPVIAPVFRAGCGQDQTSTWGWEMTDMINIGAMVDSWRATPGAIIHPKLSNAVDAARAAFKANKMTDITERLRRLYVQDGTNYVTEAADLIECLRAERKALVNDVHSCGPTCAKAGCVNRRLRERVTHLEQLVTDAVYMLSKARMWNGMGWTYNPLHPVIYTQMRERLSNEADAIHAALGETK